MSYTKAFKKGDTIKQAAADQGIQDPATESFCERESGGILSSFDDSPKMLTQVFSAIVIALTHLGVGAIFGFSGICLPQLTQPDSEDIYLSPNNAALYGSLVIIGAAIGSVATGIFLVRFGQRSVLLVSLPVSLITWILHGLAPVIPVLFVARFVLGMNAGLLSIVSGTYVMELAHKDYRGLLFATVPMARQLGHFFMAGLGMSSIHWRHISFICGIVTTVPSFLGLFFIPNSPRWLVTRGRVTEAEKSLKVFRGSRYDVSSELKDIVSQVSEQESAKSSYCTQVRLLGNKSTLRRFLTVLFITVGASMNGTFVIVTYLVPIFQASSSDVDAYTSAMWVGAIKVAGTIISLVVVDRLGRRPLLIGSYLINSLSLAVLGAYFYADRQGWDVTSFGWVPLTSLLCYTLFMGIAVPVKTLVRGELLPTSVRSVGFSILITTMFGCGFIVTMTYPLTVEAMGEAGAFWIYSTACAVVAVFSIFALPETRKRSLEQIGTTPK